MPDPAAPSTPTRPSVADALYRPLDLRANPFPAALPVDGAMASIQNAARHLAEWASSASSSTQVDGHLAIITGAARSGRTTMLRATMAELANAAPARITEVTLCHAHLTPGRFLRAIVTASGETPVGRNSLDLVRQMHRHAANAPDPLVLIIDGAIGLDGSHLDVLRSLLIGGNPIRLIVTGTPELADRIQRRQSLADRLSYRHDIAPLSDDDLATYLQQRIDAVTLADETRPASFTPEAIAIITAWSTGIIGPAIEVAEECVLEAIARGKRIIDGGIAHDVTREFIDRARLAARHRADAHDAAPATQAVLDLAQDITSTARDLTRTGASR